MADKQALEVLDAQVALMEGWHSMAWPRGNAWIFPGDHYVHPGPPAYSARKDLAWELIEKYGMTVGPVGLPGEGWFAGKQGASDTFKVREEGDTYMEAVARAVAALRMPESESLLKSLPLSFRPEKRDWYDKGLE